MKTLLLTLLTVLLLQSCKEPVDPEKYTTFRAISIQSGIPAPIQIKNKDNIYRKGDTVWVHNNTLLITKVFWTDSATEDFSKFVITNQPNH